MKNIFQGLPIAGLRGATRGAFLVDRGLIGRIERLTQFLRYSKGKQARSLLRISQMIT